MRLLLPALFALVPLLAAAQPPSGNVLLEETTIRSGTTTNFESTHKDFCAAVVHSGVASCLVFATATFGAADRYLTLAPFTSFARFDDPAVITKGLTPEEARALLARRMPWIVTDRSSTLAAVPELSFTNAPRAAKPLHLLREYRLRPGHLDAFLSAVRTLLLPQARASGTASFEVYRTTLGESPDRILILTRVDTFAQFNEPTSLPPAWTAALAEHVQSTETAVLRYRPDLSTESAAINPPAPPEE